MKIITCKDGKKIRRISRWISIREDYDITPRHSLWDYATDTDGYGVYSDHFDPAKGTYVMYFRFGGRKYALEDFYRCGSPWVPVMYNWEEEDGLHYMSGVEMSGDIFHPLLIELDECAERVRVYEEI